MADVRKGAAVLCGVSLSIRHSCKMIISQQCVKCDSFVFYVLVTNQLWLRRAPPVQETRLFVSVVLLTTQILIEHSSKNQNGVGQDGGPPLSRLRRQRPASAGSYGIASYSVYSFRATVASSASKRLSLWVCAAMPLGGSSHGFAVTGRRPVVSA